MSKEQHSWSKDDSVESIFHDIHICKKCGVKVGHMSERSKIIHKDGFVHTVENGEAFEVHYKSDKLSVYCDDIMIYRIMNE